MYFGQKGEGGEGGSGATVVGLICLDLWGCGKIEFFGENHMFLHVFLDEVGPLEAGLGLWLGLGLGEAG